MNGDYDLQGYDSAPDLHHCRILQGQLREIYRSERKLQDHNTNEAIYSERYRYVPKKYNRVVNVNTHVHQSASNLHHCKLNADAHSEGYRSELNLCHCTINTDTLSERYKSEPNIPNCRLIEGRLFEVYLSDPNLNHTRKYEDALSEIYRSVAQHHKKLKEDIDSETNLQPCCCGLLNESSSRKKREGSLSSNNELYYKISAVHLPGSVDLDNNEHIIELNKILKPRHSYPIEFTGDHHSPIPKLQREKSWTEKMCQFGRSFIRHCLSCLLPRTDI